MNQPNMLDQFLVNKNMVTEDAPISIQADTVEIMRFDGTFTGEYRRPKPYGGMGKEVDETGFSDHFPIGVRVVEAD